MTGARLKHYGWGREGEEMSAEERKFVLGRYRVKFARDAFDIITVPRLAELSLRAPRLAPPAATPWPASNFTTTGLAFTRRLYLRRGYKLGFVIEALNAPNRDNHRVQIPDSRAGIVET